MIGGFAGVLRPSAAHRWGPGACPASPRMEAAFPEDDGPEAREGTAAHFYATEAAQGRVWPVGSVAPNGHPIDADMQDGGAPFLSLVASILSAASPTAQHRFEQFVRAHRYVHAQNEGTPDFYCLDAVRRRVDLVDFKYGFSYVDVWRNPQITDYLACILDENDLTREETADWTVAFHVVQPRYFSGEAIRTWTTTGAEAWGLIDGLRLAAHEATAVNAPARTGPHCKNCTARTACDAFRQTGGAFMDFAGAGVPSVMPPDALAVQLRLVLTGLQRLEAMKTGLEQEALAHIARGVRVPGFTKGFTSTKETWNVDAAEVIAMGDLLGLSLASPAKPITPYQAKKLAKEKGIDEAVIAAYAFRPPGAAKLVQQDDNQASRVFGAAPPRGPDDQ